MMGDDEIREFTDCGDMTEFIAGVYGTSRAYDIPIRSLTFAGYADASGLAGTDPADLDTVANGTKLFLSFASEKGEQIRTGIRACALASLHERIGISGTALYKMDPSVCAEVMNRAAEVSDRALRLGILKERKAEEKARVLIMDGKCSAVLSAGDTGNKYSAHETDNLIFDMQDAIYQMADDIQAFRGQFSYSYISCSWLTDRTEMLDGKKYSVQIDLLTSDIGLAAVTLGASLAGNGKVLPLADDIKVIHKQAITLFDLNNALETLLNSVTRKVTDIEALKKVPIEYPLTCMKRVARACRLPKRETEKMIDTGIFTGDTAFDCFLFLADIMNIYAPGGGSAEKYRKVLAGNISKMITIRWQNYDLPTC